MTVSRRTPNDVIDLSLAGRRFAFVRDAAAPALCLPPVYDQFRAAGTAEPEAARYTVLAPDPALLPRIDPRRIVWQSEHWCLAASGDAAAPAYLLALHALPDERRVTIARLAADFSGGLLLPIAGRHGAPAPHSCNYPCDQVIVLNRLVPYGVGVVHAGGVAFGGQGLLFCGRSGAGKTTLSRLCRDAGATLLNDDRQFIWPTAEGGMLAPTPWHGSDPEVHNVAVPLRAILHLVQAPHNRLTRLHGADAVARLVGNTVAPFYFPAAMERILEGWDRLTARVPTCRLEFTPDPRPVALLRETFGV